MRIQSVQVQNFRSILNETLVCDDLTALAGANGCGKSTFLRAIDLFYEHSPKIELADYYNRDPSAEIAIGITFTGLSPEAKEQFAGYIQGDSITVERVFRWDGAKVFHTYHGASQQHEQFQKIRDGLLIKDRGNTAKEEYEALRKLPDYSTLAPWSKIQDTEPALAVWEAANLDKCVRKRDNGRFFGFTEVGQGYLGRYTRFLFIPAVRDASDDAIEGRGSVLTGLMDLVVRSVLANKESVISLRAETQAKYSEIMRPDKLEELQTLSKKLSATLQTFVPNADVELNWLPLGQIELQMPKADVKLIEDQYATAVQRAGHGLQRAFIFTMLQHLAMTEPESQNTGAASPGTPAQEESAKGGSTALLPNLILAIEEPELYQHPNRQRHLAAILLKLAQGTIRGVAEKTQVMYATHSPFFVGLDRFNQIRLLRKVRSLEGKPRTTKIVSATLDQVAEKVWEADGSKGDKYSAETLIQRLHSIMTPMLNEGFFADVVVLVEGEDDQAAILGMARALNHNLESLGVSIIPVGGKRSLDRPAIIFREFGIPVYTVWDGDGDKGASAGVCGTCGKALDGKPDPTDNHRLLRIVGEAVTDWPTCQTDQCCCFKRDMESTLKAEVGAEAFETYLADCQNRFAIPKRKHAVKNPNVVSEIIRLAKVDRKTSETLERIVGSIVKMAQSEAARKVA